MSHPIITVIIPVYNGEKFLPACLGSLLAQTFSDWEAICVNDGSKDNSLRILQEYATRDTRFRVIDQPNAGVSAARNAALDEAKGTYITMVDCDDEMLPDGLQIMLDAMLAAENVDMVMGAVQDVHVQTGEVHVRGTLLDGNERSGCYSPCELMRSFLGLAVAKLFRKAVLEQYAIRYRPDVRVGEDFEFALQYLLCCQRVNVVQKAVYSYVHHGESVSDVFICAGLPLVDYYMQARCRLDLLLSMPPRGRQTPLQQQMCVHILFLFYKVLLAALHICRKSPRYTLSLTALMFRGSVQALRHVRMPDICVAWRDAAHASPKIFRSYLRFLSFGRLGAE